MYKQIINAIILCMCTLAAGCTLETGPDHLPEIFEFSNQSNHTITIVPSAPYDIAWPNAFDSLSLQHQESFSWVGYGDIKPYASGSIYYDSRYKIEAQKLPLQRQIDNPKTYTHSNRDSEEYGELLCYTYTFTEKDYQYAVENGIDLQSAQ